MPVAARFTSQLAVAIGLLLLTAPAAEAGGLPVTNLDRQTARSGIAAPDGSAHYYAVPLEGRTRVVKAKPTPDGRSRRLDATTLEGTLAVPGVVHDTTTGISADGSTLVLIRPRRGAVEPTTSLALLDTKRMRQIETAELDGYFGVYAVSPDGGTAYLIHYLDPDWDARKNAVRAYDVAKGRLRPDAIVDRPAATEPKLRGELIARAISPDGVWAYTLYDGGDVYSNEDQFISALDTASGASTRIDIETDKRKHGLVVSPDGGTISVLGGQHGRTAATVEVGTWRVTEWAAGSPVGSAQPARSPDDPTLPAWWVAAATGIGLMLAIAGYGRRRRRHASRLPEDPLPDLELESLAEAERKREPVG